MNLIAIATAIGIGVFIAVLIKAFERTPNAPRSAPAQPVNSDDAPPLRGDGRFAADVVGESFYRQSFVSLTKHRWASDAGDELDFTAVLTLDDENPHDDQAVAVLIKGLPVGHLSREMARDFRDAVRRDGLTQWRRFSVQAKVWIPDEPEEEPFSVRLNLPLA